MTKEELEEARLKLGFTKKELAEALNTPYSTIMEWRSGRRNMPGIVEVAIECLFRRAGKLKEWRQWQNI